MRNKRIIIPEDWYIESFKSDFERIYHHKNETAKDEVTGILEYAQLPQKIQKQPPLAILDLCCGWGRHALEFASRGYDVTGIDLSEIMLEMAGRDAAKARLRLRLMRADMRKFSLTYKVRLAVNLWTSFGYFTDESENQAVLKNVLAALEPGGVFILDIDNISYFLKTTGITNPSIPAHNGTKAELIKQEFYMPERSRRLVTYRFLNPHKAAERENIYLECRLYLYEDIREMLLKAGFQVDPRDKWGDFHGGPLKETSPRMIILARKPSS